MNEQDAHTLASRLSQEYPFLTAWDARRLVLVCEGHEELCRKIIVYCQERGMPSGGVVMFAQTMRWRAGGEPGG